MPAYATRSDLENLRGAELILALADKDADGAVDDAVVDNALLHASSVVDSYLTRFLPLGTVTEVIRQVVIDLALYRIAGQHATDEQRNRHNDAMAWLRDVARGRAYPGFASTADQDIADDIEIEVGDVEYANDSLQRVL
jgi:phage gp36-like protein